MKKSSLFSEFTPVSAKQWKQKIQVDLKGADYNETLVWESPEGIAVKPFYHKEDVSVGSSLPKKAKKSWAVGQHIFAGNEKAANSKAKDVLDRGATELLFTLPEPSVNWEVLLEGLPLKETTIHFIPQFLALACWEGLLAYLGTTKVRFYIHQDCVGHLAKEGNWHEGMAADFTTLDSIYKLVSGYDGIALNTVDLGLYQNAGATIVQQLAYGLAHANEYLDRSEACVAHAKKFGFLFKVAVGPNYFFEIAKLQALRRLWKTLSSAYNITSDCHIVATPSKRNKTLYDYNVNMLRTTSECMSAVLGGADTVCNLPYDALYHKDNEFGDRIARNQLLLLKEESYFDEASTAASGTYYIESLTEQLAHKGLALFKQIEASGGFLSELKKGHIQKKIKTAADKEQDLFNQGELVLLGTNKFQNPQDRMKNDLELYPFLKQNQRKTLLEPILERRLAEAIEQKRLDDE